MKHLDKLIALSPVLIVWVLRMIKQEVGRTDFTNLTMYTTAVLLAVSIYACVTAYAEHKIEVSSIAITRWMVGISVSLTLLVFTMFLRELY